MNDQTEIHVHFAAESITDKTVRCPYCCNDEILQQLVALGLVFVPGTAQLAAIDVSKLVEAQ